MWEPTGHIDAIEEDAARVGGENPADHIERSGFARPIGPDETGDGPFLHSDRAAAQGLNAAIGLADLAGFEQIGYEPLLTSSG